MPLQYFCYLRIFFLVTEWKRNKYKMEIFSNNCIGALKRIKAEKPVFK